MSIVRENLLSVPGYTPYCGSNDCTRGLVRTKFDGSQFKCSCGWRSSFEPEFIEKYRAFSLPNHQESGK
jgi:hypothetical protein